MNWGIVVATAVCLGASVSSAQSAHSYLVEITGAGGATFSGECAVENGADRQRIPIEGSPPWRRELSGTGVRCTVTQTSTAGSLAVRLRRLDGRASQAASLQGRGSTTQLALD